MFDDEKMPEEQTPNAPVEDAPSESTDESVGGEGEDTADTPSEPVGDESEPKEPSDE